MLLAERDAELRRVRGLYVALAEGSSGFEDEAEAYDKEDVYAEPESVDPVPRTERRRSKPAEIDLERLADTVLRIGERLGLVGPASAGDEGADDDE